MSGARVLGYVRSDQLSGQTGFAEQLKEQPR